MTQPSAGLVRPNVTEAEAQRIAHECYGLTVTATELGSNQDRNFLLTGSDGSKSVLRVDNPVFTDSARDGQHAALAAYRDAGVPVASVLPGLNGELTQHSHGYAVRLSEFAAGETLVGHGYLAPVVLEEFGTLAAASVRALAEVTHHGLDRPHMWDMRVAHQYTVDLAASITDSQLRTDVLRAADAAWASLAPIRDALPVQAIHGDLTDDNVMGRMGDDARVHPHTVLDLGDLALGWRVAEIAVTVASMLHHDPQHPLRVLHTVEAYQRVQPLTDEEAEALWPLVVLRAAVMVASGWRQLELDGDNAYARERIAGEQAIFDAATSVPLVIGIELVRDIAGVAAIPAPSAVTEHSGRATLQSVLPGMYSDSVALDVSVESPELDSGIWLRPDAETELVKSAWASGADAAVLPYGVYRLTRVQLDAGAAGDGVETWPTGTGIWVRAGVHSPVISPVFGEVIEVAPDSVTLSIDAHWQLRFVGLRVKAALLPGQWITPEDVIGHIGDPVHERFLAVTVLQHRVAAAEAAGLLGDAPADGLRLVAPGVAAAWDRFTTDPAELIGLRSRAQRDTASSELRRRERIFASAQERYYERPMQVERGWKHHLIDVTGRSYIDMVNNVTGLGHGHPGVADAVNRQIRVLNTNSRFLYRGLAEYSERLLALMPTGSDLDTVLLVNSGSEAVDLALRLAQAATGRKTVVALREAYHGWTMASDAVTTSAYDNPFALENRPEWVHVADVPNTYRGTYRGPEAADQYVTDLRSDLSDLAAAGRPVAGFICESLLGNAGGVELPAGYLRGAYAAVRESGGVCIADEVQVGFGRMGSTFWGFEQSGVVPDIVTIAKPMGNGFPIGGVITSKRIADALASQGQFFSSAGGNPLSCAVGIAVLDAMDAEGLQENARVVGEYLATGFRALAERHEIIGLVHGQGLYLGVELVRSRDTKEPATAEAAAICERLREMGVVMLTTSERSNVLKVKPPLTLTTASADTVLEALDRVLSTGW